MKKSSKKKRGSEKEKKAKKKTALNERETLSYEQQIVDNNRQLARLRGRNEELESEVDNLKQKLRQLEEDRSDVVAHLKRNLEERIEEARELNERLSAFEELRKEELAAFKKKEDAMELEYRTMESNLTAEVKLAAGKLNALEDWRLARLDLMHKFEMQEERMAEQETRHKEMLYEAEKALIIGKAKMQKEMQRNLDELSEKIRSATQLRIADATHRAIRENIALNQELDAMLEICHELEMKNTEYKDTDRVIRLQADLFEAEAKIVMNKALKQRKLIDKLAHDYGGMNFIFGRLKHAHDKILERQKTLENYKMKALENEDQIRTLQKNIAEIKEKEERVAADARIKCKEYTRLNGILDEVKDTLLEFLQLQEESSVNNSCTCHHVDIKDKLLRSLFNILTRQNISNKEVLDKMTVKIDDIECQYEYGNLGLLRESQFLDGLKRDVDEQVEEYSEKEEQHIEEKKNSKESLVKQPEGKVPSCVLSAISSEILSPRETLSGESVDKDAA